MLDVLVGLCVVFSAFASIMSLFTIMVLWEKYDKEL